MRCLTSLEVDAQTAHTLEILSHSLGIALLQIMKEKGCTLVFSLEVPLSGPITCILQKAEEVDLRTRKPKNISKGSPKISRTTAPDTQYTPGTLCSDKTTP